MATALSAARVNQDDADGLTLTTGCNTIFCGPGGPATPLACTTGTAGQGAVITSGEPTVIVENNLAARITDALSDGSTINSGSQTVFIGVGG
jgi:uncharacterized Zn-binding protein involved in type VI secretion